MPEINWNIIVSLSYIKFKEQVEKKDYQLTKQMADFHCIPGSKCCAEVWILYFNEKQHNE